MADCQSLSGCPFFNGRMANMPSMAESYKKHYCHGEHSQCARAMVSKALGKAHVPGDLFPNQVERAQKLITAG